MIFIEYLRYFFSSSRSFEYIRHKYTDRPREREKRIKVEVGQYNKRLCFSFSQTSPKTDVKEKEKKGKRAMLVTNWQIFQKIPLRSCAALRRVCERPSDSPPNCATGELERLFRRLCWILSKRLCKTPSPWDARNLSLRKPSKTLIQKARPM